MDYHIFLRKTKKNPKGSWYYWYYDPLEQRRIQKVCLNPDTGKCCARKYEAELVVSMFPPITTLPTKIRDLANTMYLPGSLHEKRRTQIGKSVKPQTMKAARSHLDFLIEKFGECDIRTLSAGKVIDTLIQDDRSASWKNQVIACLKEVYRQANWNGLKVQTPTFENFKGRPRKADVFTTDEINQFLKRENFKSDTEFACIALTYGGGLRASEARGFYTNQLMRERQMILVNGFMDRSNNFRNNFCKKGSPDDPKWRVAILFPKAAEIVFDYVDKYNPPLNDFLFKFEEKPFRIELMRKVFNRALKKSGIEKNGRKLTLHSLRYTFVTQMREVLSGDVVQKMVGHTTIAMTDYYTRPGLASASNALSPYISNINANF